MADEVARALWLQPTQRYFENKAFQLKNKRIKTLTAGDNIFKCANKMQQIGHGIGTVLFIGNITQDTVITYQPVPEGSDDQKPSESLNKHSSIYEGYATVSKSLGGSVTFGCLAFQRYTSSLAEYHQSFGEQPFHPQIISKIGKGDVVRLIKFFQNGTLDDEESILSSNNLNDFSTHPQVVSPSMGYSSCFLTQPDQSMFKRLKNLSIFENMLIEEHVERSKLTQYELCYPPFSSEGNHRTLKCINRGSILNEEVKNITQRILCGKSMPNIEAIFLVPVAAEFDHLFVEELVSSLRKSMHNSWSPIICTDIQGYLRKIDEESGQVLHNSFEYMQHVLKTLGRVVSIIKMDLEEAKKCLFSDYQCGNIEEYMTTPEYCAQQIQLLYGFPIVTITMGAGGCICSCLNSSNLNLSMYPATSDLPENTKAQLKYFPAYTPRRVQDETGAGDTFLSCLIAELLIQRRVSPEVTSDMVFHAVKMASSSTSFRVEERGLNGFTTRHHAANRVLEQDL